jgi:hypothetical protein
MLAGVKQADHLPEDLRIFLDMLLEEGVAGRGVQLDHGFIEVADPLQPFGCHYGLRSGIIRFRAR